MGQNAIGIDTVHEYAPLIESSDMTPDDSQTIACDITANYDRYDGFVILPGTDTMAFTASALSFILENLNKPVIVTSSQIPLEALRYDGQTNLLNALYLAAHYPVVDMGGYATGNALASAGVLSGFDMTVEAALTKLHFLLSQSLPCQDIRRLMQQDLRGELSSNDASGASHGQSVIIG